MLHRRKNIPALFTSRAIKFLIAPANLTINVKVSDHQEVNNESDNSPSKPFLRFEVLSLYTTIIVFLLTFFFEKYGSWIMSSIVFIIQTILFTFYIILVKMSFLLNEANAQKTIFILQIIGWFVAGSGLVLALLA